MEQKQSKGLGGRGWVLIIFQAIAFLAFTAFTNYPMNLLAGSGFYGGWTGDASTGDITGTALVSTIYTIAAVVAVVIQLVLSRFMGKIKRIKPLCMILGAIGLAIAAFITFYPPTMNEQGDILWLILYGIECVVIVMYSTFSIGVLVGQWFPRKKGTVMGIATLMFPIANGVIGFVANAIFATDVETQMPYLIEYSMSGGMAGKNTFMTAMLPFLIICVIGYFIGLFFIKDYPEDVGAFRDNDKSMTPEVAQKMVEMEMEAKKTTVWTTGHTLANRDFWFITIPAGLLLMFSVGAMTQTSSIFAMCGLSDSYQFIMFGICAAGLVGSYVLGIIDTKIGTKKSMTMAMALMIVSGILGLIGALANVPGLIVASFIILGLFMGASSNYTVSAAAQYWRGEDFSSVFACLNPIANLIQAFGPMLFANLLFGSAGLVGVFVACAVAGVVSVILMLLFSGKHVASVDNKYREKAGKPVDDQLLQRL